MPIYTYSCLECEANFEKILTPTQRDDNNFVVPCPECGSEVTYRTISKSSFSLKGGGLYKDGYSTTSKSEP